MQTQCNRRRRRHRLLSAIVPAALRRRLLRRPRGPRRLRPPQRRLRGPRRYRPRRHVRPWSPAPAAARRSSTSSPPARQIWTRTPPLPARASPPPPWPEGEVIPCLPTIEGEAGLGRRPRPLPPYHRVPSPPIAPPPPLPQCAQSDRGTLLSWLVPPNHRRGPGERTAHAPPTATMGEAGPTHRPLSLPLTAGTPRHEPSRP
jgi:hypothetical protein